MRTLKFKWSLENEITPVLTIHGKKGAEFLPNLTITDKDGATKLKSALIPKPPRRIMDVLMKHPVTIKFEDGKIPEPPMPEKDFV